MFHPAVSCKNVILDVHHSGDWILCKYHSLMEKHSLWNLLHMMVKQPWLPCQDIPTYNDSNTVCMQCTYIPRYNNSNTVCMQCTYTSWNEELFIDINVCSEPVLCKRQGMCYVWGCQDSALNDLSYVWNGKETLVHLDILSQRYLPHIVNNVMNAIWQKKMTIVTKLFDQFMQSSVYIELWMISQFSCNKSFSLK